MSSQQPRQVGATEPVAESLKVRIGRRIKEARVAQGLTQRELAVRLDTDAMQISRWERGKHRPDAHYEVQLALALFGGDIGRMYDVNEVAA